MSGIFRADHLILFNFQLAMMYQRGLDDNDPESFSETEWRAFLTMKIDDHPSSLAGKKEGEGEEEEGETYNDDL